VTRVPRELWPVVCRLATSREWPPRNDTDIAAFFSYANRQKLLPLLMADEDLPPAVAAAKPRFRALDALYRKRHELSREATLELRRVLGADAFLFYKGSDFRHRLYARPELRPMEDIDVYLPSADMPMVLRKLAAAGYPRKYTRFGAAFSPGHHEIPVLLGGVLIELHRSFSQQVRAAIDYHGMWKRREWFEKDGIAGHRLSPADAVLAQAFEMAKDEFGSELHRYVDFQLLLRRYQNELPSCVARAKAWDIERPLFGALYVTSALFPSERTAAIDEAMEALLDAPTRRFLVDRVLPDPATGPSGYVAGRRIHVWRKFALIDRRWRRVAFVAYQVYETAIGSVMEWRVRRSGLDIPPRPARSR
jgi:hypothetical protein